MTQTVITRDDIADGADIRNNSVSANGWVMAGNSTVNVVMTQTSLVFSNTTSSTTYNINTKPAPLYTQVEVDFGASPVRSKRFTLTGTAATTTSKIFAMASSATATGRKDGDLEMDSLECAAHCPTNGTIMLNITANPGPIKGKRLINYFLG